MNLARLAVVVAVLAACKHGPRGPHARGALVFDADAVYGGSSANAERAKSFFATEATVVASQRIRERAEIDAGAIDATRRGDTLVLEITVTGPDARARCDRLMQAYIDARRDEKVTAMREELLATDDLIAHGADSGTLVARRDQLEIDSRLQKSDVRLLEPCR